MHGRVKVKTTAEQAEAKRKEREKKLKFYKGATSVAFSKRAKQDYGSDLMTATAELLSANPDFYTLWNIRREAFQQLKHNESSDTVQTSLDAELTFLEQCLRVNPKSYGTWHHRGWVVHAMPTPDWHRELQLCNKFLEHDERNFHCWDYRRLVVQASAVSPEDELAFTSNKIETNFSNYSSWHYRSKLLPRVHGDPQRPAGITAEQRVNECLLAQNAFFTDPNDQSAWFYHRWLLGRVVSPLRLESVQYCHKQRKLVMSLSQHIRLGPEYHKITVKSGDEALDVSWQNAGEESFSQVWYTSADVTLAAMATLSVCVTDRDDIVDEREITLPSGGGDVTWQRPFTAGKRFCQELSAVTSEVLQEEVEMLGQLHEMEPDNKWVLLTLLSLMRALDPLRYAAETDEIITKLVTVDATRRAYYLDLRSRYEVENVLESLPAGSSSIDLSGHRLTTLSHTDHLVTMTTVDLGDNTLTGVQGAGLLQGVCTLRLDHNALETCTGLRDMDSLEELSICSNKLSTLEDLKPLVGSRRLRKLTLTNNPVCASCCHDDISALFPGVEVTC